MPLLDVAFKEWSAVCAALASGRQTLLLRKGGIHEEGGHFKPEYDRFWLWPTHFHERQRDGLKAGVVIPAAESPGAVTLSHFAVVQGVQWLSVIQDALDLDAVHVWDEATIRQRFAYRTPGLYCLNVRIWRVPEPFVVTETPEQAGCRSWVRVLPGLPTENAEPVQVVRPGPVEPKGRYS
jgi:hypothetical protein